MLLKGQEMLVIFQENFYLCIKKLIGSMSIHFQVTSGRQIIKR